MLCIYYILQYKNQDDYYTSSYFRVFRFSHCKFLYQTKILRRQHEKDSVVVPATSR
jgi:hypothetical protein